MSTATRATVHEVLSDLPGMDELPYDFGENLESEAHRSNGELLTAALQLYFADQPDIYVGANMAIYFSARQVKSNDFRGPDVFVVKGAARKERKSWVVWEELCGPDVVVELLSDKTRHVDMGEKMRIYARQLRVSWYYLFDPDTLEFHAWERDNASNLYVACPRDGEDRVACPALGLFLGPWTGTFNRVERTWLRWFLPDGRVLPVGSELAEAERARADAERAKADAERAKADAERAKAEAERLRADEAQQALGAERARADAAQAALAALQARLAALGLS